MDTEPVRDFLDVMGKEPKKPAIENTTDSAVPEHDEKLVILRKVFAQKLEERLSSGDVSLKSLTMANRGDLIGTLEVWLKSDIYFRTAVESTKLPFGTRDSVFEKVVEDWLDKKRQEEGEK